MKNSTLLLIAVSGMTTLFSAGKAAADFLYVSDPTTDQLTVINTTSGTSQVLNSNLLSTPTGVAVSGGNVYIADSGNGDVTEYNTSTGNFTQFYNGGGLSTPQGMTFDSSGNLFVTNYANGTISEFASGTNVLTQYASGLTNPYDVVSAGSVLYATQNGSNEIAQIFPNGSTGIVITNFYPGAGSNPGLDEPTGITLDTGDTGNLYVSNGGANSVFQVTVAPKGSTSISGGGSQLNVPEGLVFDDSGFLYVADATGNEVTEYVRDPSNPTTFTFVKSFNQDLNDPQFLAFAPGPAVPEPSTYALLLGGLGALYFFQRRRTRALATVKA
jgi:sugar lactone lactonase YvrE